MLGALCDLIDYSVRFECRTLKKSETTLSLYDGDALKVIWRAEGFASKLKVMNACSGRGGQKFPFRWNTFLCQADHALSPFWQRSSNVRSI